jgi:hypothetical protein
LVFNPVAGFLPPLQTGRTGPGEEANFAFSILYLPMLSGVVEFAAGNPGNFKPAKFMERYSLGPKTKRALGSSRLNSSLNLSRKQVEQNTFSHPVVVGLRPAHMALNIELCEENSAAARP